MIKNNNMKKNNRVIDQDNHHNVNYLKEFQLSKHLEENWVQIRFGKNYGKCFYKNFWMDKNWLKQLVKKEWHLLKQYQK